ncbi:DUF748 domain-containing protein [Pontibacter silvestris]|uniref:DUF748 domain-containing protein n=1 Tax=Pontibacter silvestris TaxID=2305183 RepID=A0ABW4WV31_9BACT|nr:DUF748 domain-containing protein [Pontibacter silvestris]MCC9136529.1 DUF748 domain-containing protein [Pontibacter silvestris]
MFFKRSFIIAAGVVLLLISIRIALPYIVKKYVNKTLNELPGYSGHVEDIDLYLYRGAYKIEGLLLEEEGGNPKYPFLKVSETDLSIEWKSLLKGKLVGEVTMERPQLNIVAEEEKAAPKEEPSKDSWTEVVKDLIPITINRFSVNNGKLAYLDFNTEPHIDLHINNMQLTALNLANVEEAGNELPSTISLTGKSVGGGSLKGKMKANLLKDIPDFNMDMELTQVDLTSINDFIKAYGKFDVERGQLDLYSELKLKDAQLNGFVKPFFENVKVLNWKKDKKEDGFFHAAWEAVAGLFSEAAENQKRDQIATKVPIEGNINQPDTDASKTFLNILRHAFIQAFNKGIQNEAPAEDS